MPNAIRTSHGPYGELVKSTEFGEFKAGEHVYLKPEFLADRVQWAVDWRWEVLCLTTNIENGVQWVELWGGSPKWAHNFAVKVEALSKVDTRRGR